ncbi:MULTISPECIES: hypothetical protein [unclassified Bacillus (in: firmicutes)]|uniref:hypothetical protein n=1 Tax=unclassified Bacillus (in: firmicutes) TaxID=185979 RepID=UPI001114012F|nr:MULTISPECIES: hypothetical protein [unclassified Bacillus (in: firmicutes)]
MRKEIQIKFRYLILIPYMLLGLSLIPNMITRVKETMDYNIMHDQGPPIIDLYVNEEKVSVKPGTCWSPDGSEGCPIDRKPYLLPIDPVGIDEFVVSGEIIVKTKFMNSKDEYSMEAYYLDGNEIKEIHESNNSFILPENIRDQVVKVTITTEPSQKLSFSFGIRNRNRVSGF